MVKTISSIPDASKFRSIIVIIFILICISSFLSYTNYLSIKAEDIAKDRVISDIKYSLAMMLYDYTIQGRQQDLKHFDRKNPFIPLAIYRQLPRNYHGVVTSLVSPGPGWYYDKGVDSLVYFSLEKKIKPSLILQMRYVEGISGVNIGRLVVDEN